MAYAEIGVGLAVLAFVVWLVWFSYRAGKNDATITTSQQDVTEAQAVTRKEQAMARAQADGPQDQAGLLARLDKGDA